MRNLSIGLLIAISATLVSADILPAAKKTTTKVKIETHAATNSPVNTPAIPSVSPSAAEPTLNYIFSDELFEDFKLVSKSTLNFHDKKIELKPVSHGMRKKKVFGLATVKVYVAEFLSAEPEKLDKSETGILASLKKSNAVQLRLTMARDLSGKKISDSFKEALEKNNIDINALSKELTLVLKELNQVPEFLKNESISLSATWKDNTATLFIQKPDGKVETITGDEKFVTDLFSIWFGIPADDKLADLKKILLK